MSKQFIVDRHTTPGTPALDPVATPKVPVYDTLDDVEADLANLRDGQIVATGGDGSELPMPVDVVEEDNLHAVTSNAVYENTNVKVCNESENQSVTVTKWGLFAYGLEEHWTFKAVTGPATVTANATFFGFDPYPYHSKVMLGIYI